LRLSSSHPLARRHRGKLAWRRRIRIKGHCR
jgi:hypothetical protein